MYSHGVNIIPESWEGASLPMLFFIRAYGQTFKVCHHQLFLEKTFNIFSSLILLSLEVRNTANK
jgi:hypothetical protein